MKLPRTFKQERASDINWAKARLTDALGTITRTTQLLDKYEILVDDIDFNLVRAKIAFEYCLQEWDKQIWETINDK